MPLRWGITLAAHVVMETTMLAVGEISRVGPSLFKNEGTLPAADARRVRVSLAVLLLGGAWSIAGLPVMAWWLATGRGPGGRLIVAQPTVAAPGRVARLRDRKTCC